MINQIRVLFTGSTSYIDIVISWIKIDIQERNWYSLFGCLWSNLPWHAQIVQNLKAPSVLFSCKIGWNKRILKPFWSKIKDLKCFWLFPAQPLYLVTFLRNESMGYFDFLHVDEERKRKTASDFLLGGFCKPYQGKIGFSRIKGIQRAVRSIKGQFFGKNCVHLQVFNWIFTLNIFLQIKQVIRYENRRHICSLKCFGARHWEINLSLTYVHILQFYSVNKVLLQKIICTCSLSKNYAFLLNWNHFGIKSIRWLCH